jgi:hypothetical protein
MYLACVGSGAAAGGLADRARVVGGAVVGIRAVSCLGVLCCRGWPASAGSKETNRNGGEVE